MRRNVLFLGQKPIGEACFEALTRAGDGIRIAGAVSNDSTANWWKSAGIYAACAQNGIPFISNAERNDRPILELIRREGVDTLISVQHAWILPKEIIEAVSGFAFNLHMAKLPEYKGYNTFSHAIINGEREYYTTLHWLAERVDSGNLVMEKAVAIEPDETAESLYKKASTASLECFEAFLRLLISGGEIPSVPLSGDPRFYSRNSLEALKRITDFSDLEHVGRVVRACTFGGFEPPYFIAGGRKYHISFGG